MMQRDLLAIPLLRRILISRWPQYIIQAIALAGFAVAILTGIFGTPVGNRNFAIVFVWIAWWALLMLAAVPLLGRAWCGICPIPLPGEWLQRGTLLGPATTKSKLGFSLGLKWPKPLRNIWVQNIAFGLVALFSSVILTQPLATAVILGAFVLVSIATAVVFERRAFCRYLCPVGGFIGLYSQLSPIELRVKSTSVCAAHTEKTCYNGSAEGYGCPWNVFTGGLVKNTYCGTCMECLRTCPHDNIAINLREFGADVLKPSGRKLDEAYKAFIMLGSAIVYSAVMLGPWGFLKSAAYAVFTWSWLLYALAFIVLVFGLLPGIFYLFVQAGRKLAGSREKPGKTFTAMAYSLVPFGLLAWVAFSISFVFANISYVFPTLSDPFGWGWNLVGTAGISWTPYLSLLVPYLQVIVLLAGLAWSSSVALKIASQSIGPLMGRKLASPVILFNGLVTTLLLGLLVA